MKKTEAYAVRALIETAIGIAHNDRDPNRHTNLLAALDKAQQIVASSNGKFGPLSGREQKEVQKMTNLK